MTHAGHSYAGRSVADMARIAEAERAGVVRAARAAARGGTCRRRSSRWAVRPPRCTPRRSTGVTEVRAGVYMFGDLFQAEIGTHALDDIAVTVLTSVIGRPAGPAAGRCRRAGAVEGPQHGGGAAGLSALAWCSICTGEPALGDAIVRRAYQEHGVVELDPTSPIAVPVGARLRIAPNHTCMTAAAHDRYYVIDGSDEVVAVWPRVNGW